MKPKRLTFIEQFIDEEPPTDVRYWRGISAYLGEECLFTVVYNPRYNKFDDFDTTLGSPGNDFRRKIYKKEVRTTEEVKEFVQEMFNEYVKSLCDDSPQLMFANWLNANYNIEDGIGYWSDYTDDDRQYTTEELWNKFNQQIKDEN